MVQGGSRANTLIFNLDTEYDKKNYIKTNIKDVILFQ